MKLEYGTDTSLVRPDAYRFGGGLIEIEDQWVEKGKKNHFQHPNCKTLTCVSLKLGTHCHFRSSEMILEFAVGIQNFLL